MQLEQLAVDLRQRTPWEASDLGTVMFRQWWIPIIRVWLAVYLPVAVLLAAIFEHRAWIAMLVLWWLKPVFDRFVLHVLSRAVFSEVPTVAQTLGAWRDILKTGVIADLTYKRLSLRRSFNLPIAQLEGPSQKSVSARARVLGKRVGAYAAAITIACLHFELIAMIGAQGLVEFFTPENPDASEFDLWDWIRGASDRAIVEPVDLAYYVAAVTLIEPLYVAQGFGLYLIRRTLLEGWDIEIGFRRLANRLGKQSSAWLTAIALSGTALLGPSEVRAAEATLQSAKEEITEIMKAPEFERYREVTQWRWKGAKRDDQRAPEVSAWFRSIVEAIAELARAFVWIIAGVLVAILLWYARRYLVELERTHRASYRPPPALFGLDVAPETLPPDIARVARSHLEQGGVREALSLLYRGALSALIHDYKVPLRSSHTEWDCVREAARTLDAERATYFAELVAQWQTCAYADRIPSKALVDALIEGWIHAFAAQPTGPPTRADSIPARAAA
jgi:hypothetical protein